MTDIWKGVTIGTFGGIGIIVIAFIYSPKPIHKSDKGISFEQNETVIFKNDKGPATTKLFQSRLEIE